MLRAVTVNSDYLDHAMVDLQNKGHAIKEIHEGKKVTNEVLGPSAAKREVTNVEFVIIYEEKK